MTKQVPNYSSPHALVVVQLDVTSSQTYRFNQSVETDEWNVHARDVGVKNEVRVQDAVLPGLILERHQQQVLRLSRSQNNRREGAEGEELRSVRSKTDPVHSHLKKMNRDNVTQKQRRLAPVVEAKILPEIEDKSLVNFFQFQVKN